MNTKILLIENSNEVFLDEFIAVNNEPDVSPIQDDDLHSLHELQIGESMHVGMLEVKRVQ